MTYSGEKQGYGYTVEIDHGDDIVTRYHHLDWFYPHSGVGDQPDKGEIIAFSGRSGNARELPEDEEHLDFEVFDNGVPRDPAEYLNKDCPAVDDPESGDAP